MQLVMWGFQQFDDAKEIITIRDRDIKKPLLKKFILLMRESQLDDPKEFFEKTKICILAKEPVWIKFLLALEDLEKKEQLETNATK